MCDYNICVIDYIHRKTLTSTDVYKLIQTYTHLYTLIHTYTKLIQTYTNLYKLIHTYTPKYGTEPYTNPSTMFIIGTDYKHQSVLV